jgi:hypothetical protein
MKTGKKYGLGLAFLATLTPQLAAQVAVPAATPATVVVTPAAPPMTIWERLGLGKAQLAACKETFCNSALGQLFNNSLRGPGAFTGGILGPCCPTGPSLEDLKRSPDSAQGAAAQIQKSEAEARARRLAVRYLGTVDCNWYPEAKAGLIGALRGDPNECVRLEAAIALGRGCCCNKDTIKALTNVLSPRPKDGNPVENSERVKAAAYAALDHCLARQTPILENGNGGEKPPNGPEKPPEPIPPPEKKPGEPTSAKSNPHVLDYYQRDDKRTMAQVVEEARRVMESNVASTQTLAVSHTSGHSVAELLVSAMSTNPAPPTSSQPVSQPAAAPEPAPARLQPQAPSAVQPVVYKPVSVYAPAAPPVASVQPTPQLDAAAAALRDALGMLQNGTSPEHREWAANYLSTVDWHSHPEIVPSLLTAARTDTAAAVRAQCIRCLVRMQANTLPVVNALRDLKADSDSHVRQEAEEGLVRLATCQGGACPRAK